MYSCLLIEPLCLDGEIVVSDVKVRLPGITSPFLLEDLGIELLKSKRVLCNPLLGEFDLGGVLRLELTMSADSELLVLGELRSRVDEVVVDVVEEIEDLPDVALGREVLCDLHKHLNDRVVACIALKLLLKMKQMLLNTLVRDLHEHRVHKPLDHLDRSFDSSDCFLVLVEGYSVDLVLGGAVDVGLIDLGVGGFDKSPVIYNILLQCRSLGVPYLIQFMGRHTNIILRGLLAIQDLSLDHPVRGALLGVILVFYAYLPLQVLEHVAEGVHELV